MDTPVAVDGPLLVTVRRYGTTLPGIGAAGPVFAMDRSALAAPTVVDVFAVLLPGSGSGVGLLTDTLFVSTVPDARSAGRARAG